MSVCWGNMIWSNKAVLYIQIQLWAQTAWILQSLFLGWLRAATETCVFVQLVLETVQHQIWQVSQLICLCTCSTVCLRARFDLQAHLLLCKYVEQFAQLAVCNRRDIAYIFFNYDLLIWDLFYDRKFKELWVGGKKKCICDTRMNCSLYWFVPEWKCIYPYRLLESSYYCLRCNCC